MRSGMSRVTTLPAPTTARGTDANAGQDDRTAADPHVRADVDRLPKLPLSSLPGVHRMHRRIDLHRGTEEREAADSNRTDVEHDAIEIEEHAFTELDVRTVVAEERRLHPHGVAAAGEQPSQQFPALLALPFARRVQRLAQIAGALARGDQLGVERIVQLTRHHPLVFNVHGVHRLNQSSLSITMPP